MLLHALDFKIAGPATHVKYWCCCFDFIRLTCEVLAGLIAGSSTGIDVGHCSKGSQLLRWQDVQGLVKVVLQLSEGGEAHVLPQ
jgi:hypothetical protein